jgi:hypothetical protein
MTAAQLIGEYKDIVVGFGSMGDHFGNLSDDERRSIVHDSASASTGRPNKR